MAGIKAVAGRRARLGLDFVQQEEPCIFSKGRPQWLLGYFIFFSILRVFIVYSLEQVAAVKEEGGETFPLGRRVR